MARPDPEHLAAARERLNALHAKIEDAKNTVRNAHDNFHAAKNDARDKVQAARDKFEEAAKSMGALLSEVKAEADAVAKILKGKPAKSGSAK